MKAISYTDKTANEIVERFCVHVHWLVRVRHTFGVLYEDEQPSCQALIEKTAPSFFADLNRILREYLLLECAKITDPATTTGKYENFTVACLVQNITWPDEAKKDLKSLQNVAQAFRGDIDCARNKVLAHLDREAVLSGKPLGAFAEGKDKTFFDALQKICNVAHKACFGTNYGDMSTVTSGGGDVINLRKTLESAVALKVALSESSPQNKAWLYSCLERTRRVPKP